MSIRLAHRPRYSHARINPQPLNRARQEYLHQRWTYRQQHAFYPQRSLGYGLSLLPWGWQRSSKLLKRRA